MISVPETQIPAIIVEEISPRKARVRVTHRLLDFLVQDNGILEMEPSFIICLTDIDKIVSAERDIFEEMCPTEPEGEVCTLYKNELLKRLTNAKISDEDHELLWHGIYVGTPMYVFEVEKAYESHPDWKALGERVFAAVVRFCTPRQAQLTAGYDV